jgi:hypothetical protein
MLAFKIGLSLKMKRLARMSNYAIRVCHGPSTCARTFKHGDPGYEVGLTLARRKLSSVSWYKFY